ncbi:hypothetical protein MNBD_GAMMA09-3659 [hydrothermal vent metagenome]|uniref:Uncharacterized protein n=1 Tax=hydrothermal vent metagenome TaxID=652676 RepID=A0A3B0YA44_9ZZZZ
MKHISHKQWILYAALLGFLSATAMMLVDTYFDSPELLSYTLPGVIYGLALYISGILGQLIIGTNRRIGAFIALLTGSTIAWYAAIKSPDYLPLGSGAISLSQMVLAGFIGAFIISLALIYCWFIKQYRSYFILLITGIGTAVPLLWYGLKAIGDFFHIEVPNFLFFSFWQVTLLIGASLFIVKIKMKE